MTARRLLALLAALAVLAAGGLYAFGDSTSYRTLTAHFSRAVGLYRHSDVRILGVKVGEVTGIRAEGSTVAVRMRYDARYHVPADAQALLFAPSIVSDRYIQLTPVWRGGPQLPDGADLPEDRTAVPVELDQIYSALDSLDVALGPRGANRHGAVSDLVNTGARNLDGNGELLHSTLQDLSAAVGTLSDNRTDLFGTVANLQQLTTTLAGSDATVRTFNADLADVAAQLAAERADLATAIRSLALALGQVSTFVQQNQADLTANVSDLASVTTVLARQKRALAEFLDNAPTALSNLQLAYNPRSGTLDTRDNNSTTLSPQGALCNLLVALGQPRSECAALGLGLGLTTPAGPAPGTPGPPTPSAPSAAGDQRDLTLGGILEPAR